MHQRSYSLSNYSFTYSLPQVPCFTRDGKRKPNANKVEAYGPGLDPGAVLPGKPTQFTVDASKTGEAPVKVEIETEDGKVPSRSIKPNGDGTHEVTYVPPPVGEPYLVSSANIHQKAIALYIE